MITNLLLIAAGATVMWSDTKAQIYVRSTTSDSIAGMRHKYTVTAKIYTDKRSSSRTATAYYTGYVNASVSLPLSRSDLGQYFSEGTHQIDCPYGLYNSWLRTVARDTPLTTGISVTCYHFVPATCSYLGMDLIGTYLRLDLEPPFPDCWVACTGPKTAQIKQWPTDKVCRDVKARYNFWTMSASGIINCHPDDPNARWYGDGINGQCTKCEDRKTDCVCG